MPDAETYLKEHRVTRNFCSQLEGSSNIRRLGPGERMLANKDVTFLLLHGSIRLLLGLSTAEILEAVRQSGLCPIGFTGLGSITHRRGTRSRVLPKLVRMVRLEPVWITFNAVPFFFDCTEDDESIRRKEGGVRVCRKVRFSPPSCPFRSVSAFGIKP